MRLAPALFVVLMGSSGCTYLVLTSEHGQLEVTLDDLRSQRNVSHRSSMPVLRGSRTRASVRVNDAPDSCFITAFDGLVYDGSTMVFDTVGVASMSFTPVGPAGCPELPDAVPDRLELQVVPPEQVVGRFSYPDMEYALRRLRSDDSEVRLLTPDALPDDLIPESGGTHVVVAGSPTPLAAVLFRDADRVLVGPGAGVLEVTGPAILSNDHPLYGTLLAPETGSGQVRFLTADGPIEIGQYEAIDRGEVRRLQAGAVMESEEGLDWTAGVAVWGIDGQGRRVHGLPVTVQVVDGPLVLPEPGTPGPWGFQPALCSPPWELAGNVVERRLRFHLGRRDVTVDLDFDLTGFTLSAEDEARERETWSPDERCVDGGANGPRGCGCAASASPGLSWGGLLALIPLVLSRRRR